MKSNEAQIVARFCYLFPRLTAPGHVRQICGIFKEPDDTHTYTHTYILFLD